VLNIDKHDPHEAAKTTAAKAEHGSEKHSDKHPAGASKDSHKEGTAKNKPDVDDLIEKRNAHLFQGLLDTGKAIGDGVGKSIAGFGEAIAKTANDAIHTAEKSTIEAVKSPVVQDEIEVLKAQQRQIAEDEHKMTAARAKMRDGFSKFVTGLGDELGAELKEIGDFFKI
ncbi:MAG: hypothetical protein K2X81_04695, partial [Candidatus Obscuribacterales bacterium]|nr:hypothetical protein [Candidatus Obscuribacterales bacterium]